MLDPYTNAAKGDTMFRWCTAPAPRRLVGVGMLGVLMSALVMRDARNARAQAWRVLEKYQGLLAEHTTVVQQIDTALIQAKEAGRHEGFVDGALFQQSADLCVQRDADFAERWVKVKVKAISPAFRERRLPRTTPLTRDELTRLFLNQEDL